MKNFILRKLNNSEYEYLLIATSFQSSLSELKKLDELADLKAGRILFDFTLSNGISKNRFIECAVSLGNVKPKSAKIVIEVEDEVKEVSSMFLKENKDILENSLLPKSIKYLISNGYVIWQTPKNFQRSCWQTISNMI